MKTIKDLTGSLKQLAFKTQRLLYSHTPIPKNMMDDSQALAILESRRPSMAKLPSPPLNLMVQPGLELSILIPAYNVTSYIRECLQSVLSQQTTHSYEVIVVDDGSTDETPSILDEFARENGVRVVHQENRGLPGARNRLLDEARGAYVMFVDSDDRLLPNAIEMLMNNTDNGRIDIVQGAHRNIDEDGNIIEAKEEHSFAGICDTYSKRISHLSGICWEKVIRRSLFRDARFVENVVFEDTLLHFVIYELCGTAKVIPDKVYEYRLNRKSISHTLQRNYKGIDTIWQVDALLQLRNRLGLRMNDDLYRMLLFQCGPMLFGRTRDYGEEILHAAFIHSAHLMQSIAADKCLLTTSQQYLKEAFEKQNYQLWKASSRI